MSKKSAEQSSQGDSTTSQEEPQATPQQDTQAGASDHPDMLAKLHEVNARTDTWGFLHGGT